MIALGWALIHFLWQGALIALMLAAANAPLRKARANIRYGVACAAMMLMVIALVVTFVWSASAILTASARGAREDVLQSAPGIVARSVPLLPAFLVETRLMSWIPWLDCLWLAGVLLIAARSAGGWFAAQRMKRSHTTPVGTVWEQRARRLAQALKVSCPVRVVESALARLPAVIGWFRPVILIPASALTGVDPQQLEALLAHELAHIRRHDYLANLVQTAAETLLFYHPAVWWVGRKIRVERENCCDDLAVQACGDVLTYARALTQLEELRAGGSRYAMAADGGALITRIRRLIGSSQVPEHGTKTWLVVALVILIAGAAWAGAQVTSSRQSEARRAAAGSDVKPPVQKESGSFIADLADAGYANLSVDQLIAFKIHGVTADYIRQLSTAGMRNLTPDDLVAFRIHGIEPKQISEMQSAGFGRLTPDQVLAIRIHGVTPDFVARMNALGFGEATVDQVLALKIHDVTPEYGGEIKALGLPGMTIDHLIAFRIHGVEPRQVAEMQSLGLGTPSADQAVALRIHDVTPDFVRSLKAAGWTDLSFDAVIAARIHGTSAIDAIKQRIKKVVTDLLIQWKQALKLPSGAL
jgi:beta-lactamase regulating signal transducer with metallopeptidase domain